MLNSARERPAAARLHPQLPARELLPGHDHHLPDQVPAGHEDPHQQGQQDRGYQVVPQQQESTVH